jgi:hypothetical protein
MSGTSAAAVTVFTGPTLAAADAAAILDATYLPPASQGDVYAAARARPWAIAIVDGYFEWVPAVWHKEILWALAHGVRVYGCSSMGALRAAELHSFGMRGVGRVFEAVATGEIEDDDEVTVVHGPEDSGFVALSDALVNLRFTLAAAERERVVDAATRRELLAVAKATFYPERTVGHVLDQSRDRLPASQLDALAEWLPGGWIDQKRLDAECMLRQIARDRDSEGPGPLAVSFRFQHTDAWEQVRRQIDRRPPSAGPGLETYPHDALLDEVRLRPSLYAELRQEALIRVLTIELGRTDEDNLSQPMLRRVTDAFRQSHGLTDAESLDRWLAEEGVSEDELVRLMIDEARSRRVREIAEADLDRAIADVLRLSGQFGELSRRAQAKHRELSARGLGNPTLADAGLDDEALWRWFFEDRLTRPVPADTAAAAAALGFLDAGALRRVVLREYCYTRAEEGRPPSPGSSVGPSP